MGSGKYRIEMKGQFPNSKWICIPDNMCIGLTFGKGMMHMARQLQGGMWSYRLVTGSGDDIEVIEEHYTGEIKLNDAKYNRTTSPIC